jgi:DNA-binding MarR family transcriptional regulator
MTEQARFSFLTSHGLVLLHVERRPDATMRELGHAVGITDRQVLRVLADLEAGGYITRRRVGRRNHYTVNRQRQRHDSRSPEEIGRLLALIEQL